MLNPPASVINDERGCPVAPSRVLMNIPSAPGLDGWSPSNAIASTLRCQSTAIEACPWPPPPFTTLTGPDKAVPLALIGRTNTSVLSDPGCGQPLLDAYSS